MDINSYNYAPHMLDEVKNVYADYEDIDGYASITLEQWGCDRNKKDFVVTVCKYNGSIDVVENYTADCSGGWETMRYAYALAAMLFNRYVPSMAAVPTF